MPDANLADNAVLTSSFYNTYIREQVVVTCTSATRPTGVQGRVIYETDTDLLLVYNGTSWVTVFGGGYVSYSPTLTNITIGNGTQTHKWRSVGAKGILVSNSITFGSTTSFSGWPQIAPPATLDTAIAVLGSLTATDVSPGQNYGGQVASNGSSQVGGYTLGTGGAFTFVSATSPFTWAVGDIYTLTYLAETT